MELNELELKLNAAEERVVKAIKTKEKYEKKIEKLEAQYNTLLNTYNINPASIGPGKWDNVPYEVYNLHYDIGYTKDAIKSSERKIKDLIQIRDNWKTKLEMQKAKDNEFSEVPQIIKDFVHNWRVKTEEWIKVNVEQYLTRRAEAQEYYYKYRDYKLPDDERDVALEKYRELYNDIKKTTDALIIDIASRGSNKEAYIKKILDEEEKRKVLDLISRVTKVTGTITDASNLTIGEQNGELNGFIQGTNGKAYVETIGAGGYAIQRFHYRVLVKKLK